MDTNRGETVEKKEQKCNPTQILLYQCRIKKLLAYNELIRSKYSPLEKLMSYQSVVDCFFNYLTNNELLALRQTSKLMKLKVNEHFRDIRPINLRIYDNNILPISDDLRMFKKNVTLNKCTINSTHIGLFDNVIHLSINYSTIEDSVNLNTLLRNAKYIESFQYYTDLSQANIEKHYLHSGYKKLRSIKIIADNHQMKVVGFIFRTLKHNENIQFLTVNDYILAGSIILLRNNLSYVNLDTLTVIVSNRNSMSGVIRKKNEYKNNKNMKAVIVRGSNDIITDMLKDLERLSLY